MPATQHAQPPDDPAEPPRRRDHESPAAGDPADSPCDCGGCQEFRAIYEDPRRGDGRRPKRPRRKAA